MASTSDFRNGLVIKFNHDLYSIVEFQHVKPGKGAAFVRTKLKNVKDVSISIKRTKYHLATSLHPFFLALMFVRQIILNPKTAVILQINYLKVDS